MTLDGNLADLRLDHLFLVHAGPHSSPLTDLNTASDLLTTDDPLVDLS